MKKVIPLKALVALLGDTSDRWTLLEILKLLHASMHEVLVHFEEALWISADDLPAIGVYGGELVLCEYPFDDHCFCGPLLDAQIEVEGHELQLIPRGEATAARLQHLKPLAKGVFDHYLKAEDELSDPAFAALAVLRHLEPNGPTYLDCLARAEQHTGSTVEA